MEQYLQVGVITKTHGVHGEVRVFPTTDDKNRFKKLQSVLVEAGTERKELEILSVRFFKQFVLLKFKGYDSIDAVQKYQGCPLFVSRENAVPLEDDEYFIADLIGLSVITEEDEKFGTVRAVMQTGANDVYVIDSVEHGEVLLPAIRECVLHVDLAAQSMKVHIPDGLW